MSSEQPLLSLGLAGFTPEQRERLHLLLGQLPLGGGVWRVGLFAEADAWLVSGEKSRLVAADTLKILAGLPTERAVQLDLEEVDRPIAFSLPLCSDDFDPKHTFDLSVPASLAAVLKHFEGWLRPLRSQFVLGGQLIARENELLPGIYHVSHKGQLLAVMDFHEWRIGILRKADPVDFELAQWDRRPLQAHDIPSHFQRSSLTHLRWIYAQRTERDVLPPRYRSKPVYFRHAPAVPMRWIRDTQLILLRELSQAAGHFDALLQRTGLTPAQLTRDLASLYFAGSITTTPDKAGTASFEGGEDSLPGRRRNGLTQAQPGAPGGPAPPPVRKHDLTAPAQLRRK
ncbi:hypothetical protein [Polaromonas sp.]|uniref:hypothetical protein n=1 Tax=Polaromonas sp. TaxID=1869339 RepID=UPI0024880EC4|nr:hypothetical protein [Polaromonas sp.]MDI1275675.1 hypothetical protein [Polaromonas sp.]